MPNMGSDGFKEDLWSIVSSFLFKLNNDVVHDILSASGILIDWQLSGKENFSNTTRNRKYRLELQTRYINKTIVERQQFAIAILQELRRRKLPFDDELEARLPNGIKPDEARNCPVVELSERRQIIDQDLYDKAGTIELQSNGTMPADTCPREQPTRNYKENAEHHMSDPKKVFVVYGRNSKAHTAMILFLRAIGLEPLEFDDVRNMIGGSPYVGDIVKRGMDLAAAIVVLMTPDEYAILDESLSNANDKTADKQRWQPRPNVILEAGLALGIDEKKTILVLVGDVELSSDLHGRHYIEMNNYPDTRSALRDALQGAGCNVSSSTRGINDIRSAGDFQAEHTHSLYSGQWNVEHSQTDTGDPRPGTKFSLTMESGQLIAQFTDTNYRYNMVRSGISLISTAGGPVALELSPKAGGKLWFHITQHDGGSLKGFGILARK